MPSIFDNKYFNAEVFQQYVERVPNTKRNELIRSRAIRPRPDLATAMAEGTGGNYITTPLKGLISGSRPKNYDGKTDITANSHGEIPAITEVDLGGNNHIVVRGGCYYTGNRDIRTAFRGTAAPGTTWGGSRGFRVAYTLPNEEP